ncbi:MAG: hypothetical protein MUC59_10115 [Saprospiraceae bacterium]|jgi:hypothetical protein|nr:hypothetical protein [Saprospiraceae bacterium]
MPATAISQPNIENRKLRLISRIAEMADENVLSLIEELVDEETEGALSNEELAIVEQRLTDFKATPNQFTTLEQLAGKIQNRQ